MESGLTPTQDVPVSGAVVSMPSMNQLLDWTLEPPATMRSESSVGEADIGRDRDDVVEVPGRREVLEEIGGVGGRRTRAGGIQQRSLSGDDHLLREFGLHDEVGGASGAETDVDAFNGLRSKTVQLRLHGVDAGRHRGESVGPGVARDRGPRTTHQGLAAGRDRHARHRVSIQVDDLTDDTAGSGLRRGRQTEEEQHPDNHQNGKITSAHASPPCSRKICETNHIVVL